MIRIENDVKKHDKARQSVTFRPSPLTSALMKLIFLLQQEFCPNFCTMNKEPKLIGKSPPIQKLRHFIGKAAKSDATVLLLGETGVGKEVAARMIHCSSDRKVSPFVKINCANLSDNLIESELFGYKKGAYTGAAIDKPGPPPNV
jgi:transcriptional regulator with PAS, ATPase and Fis domain